MISSNNPVNNYDAYVQYARNTYYHTKPDLATKTLNEKQVEVTQKENQQGISDMYKLVQELTKSAQNPDGSTAIQKMRCDFLIENGYSTRGSLFDARA